MNPIQYPLGPFMPKLESTVQDRTELQDQLSELAGTLRILVGRLSAEQLSTPYRPGGWSIRQVVHHLADNDMNAYIRLKRAITEDEPTASSYREDRWADLHDYRDAPIELSLTLLEVLHQRLLVVLSGMAVADYSRTLRTEALGAITVDTVLQRFVWHNRHHMAQIEALLQAKGWHSQ